MAQYQCCICCRIQHSNVSPGSTSQPLLSPEFRGVLMGPWVKYYQNEIIKHREIDDLILYSVSVQTAVSVDNFDPWPRLQTAHKPVPPSPGRCPGAPTNGRDQLTQLSLIQNQTKQRGCQGMFFNGITFLPFSDPASSGVSMRF